MNKNINKQCTFVELFAGAGGLSEGFIKTGFYPVCHVEMDRYAALTLKTRLGYHYLKEKGMLDIYKSYLQRELSREDYYSIIPEHILSSVINEEISEENIENIFKSIRKQMDKTGIKRINVISGGPPCQAYSVIGRARDPYKMRYDKRNYLYRLYVRFLLEFDPEIFVFENVYGLLSAGGGKLWQDIRDYFKNAGYAVDYRLLNAWQYGVLQNRRRVIIIGWKSGLTLKYPLFEADESVKKYRVNNVFEDLPPLQPGEKIYAGFYIKEPSEYLLKYGIRNSTDILTLHIARKHCTRDREIYRFYIEKWFNEKRRPEYDELPDVLKTHKNRAAFKDRFKIVAPDLLYSQTIVAHLAKDGHYFIHPDINQLRSISPREAARLQSFPDNYYFEGPMTAVFRQIGNAVPPLMAEKIALKIREMIGWKKI